METRGIGKSAAIPAPAPNCNIRRRLIRRERFDTTAGSADDAASTVVPRVAGPSRSEFWLSDSFAEEFPFLLSKRGSPTRDKLNLLQLTLSTYIPPRNGDPWSAARIGVAFSGEGAPLAQMDRAQDS